MSDNMLKAYPVLLAGGSGTRLWPVSRELFPKQLVRFFGNESLLCHTVKRLFPVFDAENVRIVCGTPHASDIARDMEDNGNSMKEKIIAEPCGRNTAPAILLAVLEILKQETDAVIFIFPADHVIKDIPRFHKKITEAIALANQDYIVTFGITPDYPETGYGYIEASENKVGNGFSIRRFVEKPDAKTAQAYMDAGNFFWNSGMFAFKASAILREFESFKPEMLHELQRIFQEDSLTRENYSNLESTSIDYAIMENTDRGVVLPSDFGWSDIGSWKSLYNFLPKDKNGNVVTTGDVILQDTKNCFVMGHERLIALNHLENMVVVETPDAVFVSDMENSREAKSVVSILKQKGRMECENHLTISYLWGYEKVLEQNNGLTIKRIAVYPGNKMPSCQPDKVIQWTIIKGTARLISEQETLTLEETQSVRIPENQQYQIENIGHNDLHFMEIIHA